MKISFNINKLTFRNQLVLNTGWMLEQ